MSGTINHMTDPTELGPPRKPGPGKAAIRSVETRVQSLAKFSHVDVMEIAERVQRSKNPLHAATNVSVAEILALTEMVVSIDESARRKLLGESS